MCPTTIQYKVPIPQESTTVAAMVSSPIRREAIDCEREGVGRCGGAVASLVFEDIADSTNRVNQFLLEWIVHLGAQASYHYFDHISVRIKVHVPDLLYDFRPRNHSTDSPRKVRQNEKFLRGKTQRGVAAQRLVATNVDLQIRNPENLFLALLWTPQ